MHLSSWQLHLILDIFVDWGTSTFIFLYLSLFCYYQPDKGSLGYFWCSKELKINFSEIEDQDFCKLSEHSKKSSSTCGNLAREFALLPNSNPVLTMQTFIPSHQGL